MPIVGDDKYGDFELLNKSLQRAIGHQYPCAACSCMPGGYSSGILPVTGRAMQLQAELPSELALFLNHVLPHYKLIQGLQPVPTGAPRMFDLIAFDWDGTLFDSTAIITRCDSGSCADVGARCQATGASHVIGMGLMQALAHAAPDVPKEKYPELGARYRHHYMARQDEISLFDGVLPMLSELKQRSHHLAVATGKSRAGLDAALRDVSLQGIV
jgi:hypothetical protein